MKKAYFNHTMVFEPRLEHHSMINEYNISSEGASNELNFADYFGFPV